MLEPIPAQLNAPDFSVLLGNEDIKSALNAAFIQGRVPHAIILQGEDGLGKRTLASLIARAAVCSGEHPPCGRCPACIRSMAGSHPDIRVEEGSGASGAISVDTIRAITEDAYRKPEEADVSVYLLFVKSKLSEAAQNKLLKLIEEPPGSTLFIMTIPSAETLLPTIRSRAQIFTLKPVNAGEAAAFIADKRGMEPAEADRLARQHRGNIGKMMGGNGESYEIAGSIAAVFDGNDEDALLAAAGPLLKNRDLFCAVLEQLSYIFRDACLCREGLEQFLGGYPEESKRLSFVHRRQSLVKLPELCREYAAMAQRNINMNLIVTAFCAKLRVIVLK